MKLIGHWVIPLDLLLPPVKSSVENGKHESCYRFQVKLMWEPPTLSKPSRTPPPPQPLQCSHSWRLKELNKESLAQNDCMNFRSPNPAVSCYRHFQPHKWRRDSITAPPRSQSPTDITLPVSYPYKNHTSNQAQSTADSASIISKLSPSL